MTYNKESNIEKVLRFIIALVVVISLAIPGISPRVFAASEVSVSGGDNVKGGDTFTVAVTFGGGNVGRVDAQMTYDTDQLTYISGGTSKGNTGYIQLKSAGTEGAIVFNIKFQAISDGEATVKVTTNEMYDFDEMPMDTPSTSKVIKIQGSASQEQLITEPADEELPEEDTVTIGVDELTEEDVDSADFNITTVLIVGAAIIVLLIIIIAVIINNNKKKKRRRAKRRR